MKKIVIFLITGLLCNLSFAQTTQKQTPLPIVNYNENVKSPLTQKELSQIKEVYAEYSNQYVLDKPQRLKDIKNILRNRVIIRQIQNRNDVKNVIELSDVALFNDFNSELKRDITFNPDTFNPLKYKLNFYSRSGYMYHVDGTNYYIILKSQFQ